MTTVKRGKLSFPATTVATELQEELSLAENAIKKVGGRLLGVAPLASFGPGGQRVAIAIEKIARTPHAYPRMEGLPKKKPL